MAKKKAKKVAAKKKTTKKKATKKTGRVGRPPGKKVGKKAAKKAGKKRGRPPGRKRVTKAPARSLLIPKNVSNELAFLSDMVVFLNKNKGKTFVVQMDGVNYSLCSS